MGSPEQGGQWAGQTKSKTRAHRVPTERGEGTGGGALDCKHEQGSPCILELHEEGLEPKWHHGRDAAVSWVMSHVLRTWSLRSWIRNTPSTAGNSMTGSERPSPEPILKKEASPAVLGGENSGNALEASNALNYRVWGIPAVLPREIPGNALRAFPGSFRNFSGISSGKSQPYWGCGPLEVYNEGLPALPDCPT